MVFQRQRDHQSKRDVPSQRTIEPGIIKFILNSGILTKTKKIKPNIKYTKINFFIGKILTLTKI